MKLFSHIFYLLRRNRLREWRRFAAVANLRIRFIFLLLVPLSTFRSKLNTLNRNFHNVLFPELALIFSASSGGRNCSTGFSTMSTQEDIDQMMAEAYCADESAKRKSESNGDCVLCPPASSSKCDGDALMEFETAEIVLMKPDGRPGPGIPLEGGLQRVRS